MKLILTEGNRLSSEKYAQKIIDDVDSVDKSEKIPGGLASGKKPKDFDSKQLKMGIKVEMEHTKNRKVAREIAMDHLTEDSKYYTHLKEMEDKHVEKGELTPKKARKILHDKEVHGHPLTEQQRKFFGAIASGQTPRQKSQKGVSKARDTTPGESLSETSTEELQQTLKDIVGRLKGNSSRDEGLQKRRETIMAELKRRTEKGCATPGMKKRSGGQGQGMARGGGRGPIGRMGKSLELEKREFNHIQDNERAGIKKLAEFAKADSSKDLGKSEDIEWPGFFQGTPMYQEALECHKERIEAKWEDDRFWREEVPYAERSQWSGAKRGEYEKKRNRLREKIDKRVVASLNRVADLEARLVDHRIAEVKARGTTKSVVNSLNDFVKAGPYIGPRGGQWINPEHTIPWRGGDIGKRGPKIKPKLRLNPTDPVDKLIKRFIADSKGTSISDLVSWMEENKLTRSEKFKENVMEKAGGPFIGPRGGKWADAKHTIPWKEGEKPGVSRKKPEGQEGKMEKALPGKMTEPGKRKKKVLTEGAAHTPPKEYREGGATSKKDYADPANYKYPIDSEIHVRAAISYFSKPKNAGVYSTDQQKAIWARIKRAAKKYGIELSEESGPPSVTKSESGSFDGLDALSGFANSDAEYTAELEKAQNMPKGNPKQRLGEGEEQGGKLAAVGKTSGDNTSGGGLGQDAKGQVTGATTTKAKLSEDDEEDEDQMHEHKKPIETAKSNFSSRPLSVPQGQRDQVVHAHAQKVSDIMKAKNPETVIVGTGLPEQGKEIQLEKASFGRQGMVAYSDQSDIQAEALLKSDNFYSGGSPSIIPFSRPIGSGNVCPKCKQLLSKSLTACPNCGYGTVVHQVRPGGEAQGDHDGKPIVKSRSGKLRPRHVEDVKIEK